MKVNKCSKNTFQIIAIIPFEIAAVTAFQITAVIKLKKKNAFTTFQTALLYSVS